MIILTIIIILIVVVGFFAWNIKEANKICDKYEKKQDMLREIREEKENIEKNYLINNNVSLNNSYDINIIKSDFYNTDSITKFRVYKEGSKIHFIYFDDDIHKDGYIPFTISLDINNIKNITRKGDMYTETNISGGEIKGGGSSLSGAVGGAILAGGVGAVVGSRKKIESTPIVSETNVIDKRQTILTYMNRNEEEYVFMDSESYDAFLRLIPSKIE